MRQWMFLVVTTFLIVGTQLGFHWFVVYQQTVVRKELNKWHMEKAREAFLYSSSGKESNNKKQQPDAPQEITPPDLRILFSQPPPQPTEPTVVHPRAGRRHEDAPCTCRLQSQPFHQWALARIVVFQKNGARQLQTQMTHYLHVLPADAIVVIDHGSYPLGSTAVLLHQLAQLGVHVWSCEGAWAHKDQMWSAVTNVYTATSEFVFPVDVDELITIPEQHDVIGGSGLLWDISNFYRVLSNLPDNAKAYKMEHAEPVPADCTYSPQVDDVGSSSVCQLTHVARRPADRWSCTDKTFARGRDFLETDTGNHVLLTEHVRKKLPHGKPAYYAQYGCSKEGLAAYYDTADLVLLHLQKTAFSDWLVHGLRGASSRGFTVPGHNCSETSGQSRHYCGVWKTMLAAQLRPDELRRVYREGNCPADTTAPGLFPLTQVFAHGCRRHHHSIIVAQQQPEVDVQQQPQAVGGGMDGNNGAQALSDR